MEAGRWRRRFRCHDMMLVLTWTLAFYCLLDETSRRPHHSIGERSLGHGMDLYLAGSLNAVQGCLEKLNRLRHHILRTDQRIYIVNSLPICIPNSNSNRGTSNQQNYKRPAKVRVCEEGSWPWSQAKGLAGYLRVLWLLGSALDRGGCRTKTKSSSPLSAISNFEHGEQHHAGATPSAVDARTFSEGSKQLFGPILTLKCGHGALGECVSSGGSVLARTLCNRAKGEGVPPHEISHEWKITARLALCQSFSKQITSLVS